ncbi:MAG: tail fiber domain-containing protein, partial [Mycoplasma sp.]
RCSNITTQRRGDHSENRMLIQLRDTGGSISNELVMYNTHTHANKEFRSVVNGNALTTIGGAIRSNGDIISLDGKVYSFVTSPNNAHLCANSYWDGKLWKKYDNSNHSMKAVADQNGVFRVYGSSQGGDNPNEILAFAVSYDGFAVARTACQVTQPYGGTAAFQSMGQCNHTEGAIVRGSVEFGSWQSWRDKAAGLLVDVSDCVASATTIWRATQWGHAHLAAMDVHAPAEGTIVRLVAGGDTSFMFYQNGQGLAPAGWHTGSDARFKENIKPIADKRISWLDKVCALNASSFSYKTNTDKQSIGFIAQNVQEIIPEAISVQIDTTKPEAERADTERLFIDPMAIIAAQNEAIKELRAMVEALQRK